MAVIEIVGGVHSHFTPLPNALIRDPNVSHKAVRVYAFLRSHSDGWRINVRNIAEALGVSKDTVNTAINELEALGYVERCWEMGDNGIRAGIRYLLFDAPRPRGEVTVSENQGQGCPWNPETGANRENEPKPQVATVSLESRNRSEQGKQDETAGRPGFRKTGTPYKEEKNTKKNTKEEHLGSPPTGVSETPTEQERFENWYQTYPRHVGKQKAFTAWKRALKHIDEQTLIEKTRLLAANHQRQRTEKQFIPHPTTWLNRGGWDDDLDTGTQQARQNGFLTMVRSQP